ncbi:helix-turn-helix transcriptional regulator [Paenibacillus sp. HN-1]|uniref:helix-turn-helix domain-containing protein n=1 Tax=Paenibacillus TaxID=44249 RepID=UPI001CA7B788|nr:MULTISPECIES: helix-turn-helix transcriptional regulator [Paenibacillus]MBY9077245.1 helix-turn-helix transcriptional regulator [Paenibacillus sp. CGMCC 1.18879]MBY9083292.1 helix-turn-helix transcriptional regulator [Paenibacillus sinensis]
MFGDLLKKLRSDRKLSLDQFVKEINSKYHTSFSKSMVSRWENNLTSPRMGAVQIIADYFNVTTDFLIESSLDNKTKENTEFEAFINDPENSLFFKELLEAPEERIKDLRKVWEIIKRSSEDEK